MRESTKTINKRIGTLQKGYFNNKKRHAAFTKGEAEVRNRFNNYYKEAMKLCDIAETPTAHANIDKFLDILVKDSIDITARFYAN